MWGAFCELDARQHMVLDDGHVVLDWARRRVPERFRDSLFLYFHLRERTFVIGHWVGPGKFEDLLNLGRNPRQIKPVWAHILNRKLVPRDSRLEQKRIRALYRDQMRQMTDQQRQENETLLWNPHPARVTVPA